ncbi:MAG: hypothetical protein ACE363_06115 [Alphaproteobacteria bacterium]
MPRVLYVLNTYPELSQTYIEAERQQVAERAETLAIALREPTLKNPEHLPYQLHTWWVSQLLGRGKGKGFRIKRKARAFAPDVVHSHWIFASDAVMRAARACDVPWTLRTHSFDILERSDDQLAPDIRRCNETDCAGILAFPFLRERLLRLGLKEEKLIDTPPVVDARRFDDLGPNGPGVIYTSAVRPKKGISEYFALSNLVSERPFTFYPMALPRTQIDTLGDRYDGRVEVRQPVAHSAMLQEWKQHTWLVYPGSLSPTGIGWPISVVEAWAAGVGVCMQRIRPDLEDYIGDCGLLFDDVAELPDILRSEPDAAMRERAHARAMDFDIRNHMPLLYDAWAKVGVIV